jgi:hypothetical protein
MNGSREAAGGRRRAKSKLLPLILSKSAFVEGEAQGGMTMNRFVQMCAVVSLVAAMSVMEASARSASGSKGFNFGNRCAGANGAYTVATENRTGYSRLSATANGNVMFLNRTVKGVEFTANAENSNGRKTATYQLCVAGYTVDSGAKTASFTWNKPVNRTLVDASMLVWVGPVPVTVRGSVGGGASIGYTVTLATSGVGLNGNASAWANGSASAGAGIPLLNLALRSDLQLAKTSLQPYINVTATSMSGGANLVFDPVNICFYVTMQTVGKSWCDLGSYTQPGTTVALLRL